jgi:uncharacterized protein (TIGR02099 family)
MLKTSFSLAWRGFGRLTRIALVGAMLLVLGASILMLGLRYWILPNIEGYHNDITGLVADAIKQPVSIGKIEADWSGMRPHLRLSEVRILGRDKTGTAQLTLQQVDGVLSWMSLLRGELRLYSLELDRPDLLVRRDAAGLLHVAGVALVAQASGQSGLADWLLHQKFLVVRDARITWLDEQRASPPLVFERLNLFVQNSGRRHQFALRGLPPAQLSAEIDLRGDFSGQSFEDLGAWHGQLFTQIDYADVGAWRAWLPLPAEFKQGRGALRGWLEVAGGKVGQLTADLQLADVRAQLATDLSPLDIRWLSGRLAWRETEQGAEFSTRRLALQMAGGLSLPPTDFYLRMEHAADGHPGGGEVRANTLELANLVSLTGTLPLDQDLKKKLAEFAPRGRVFALRVKWQNGAGRPPGYEVNAQFDQLSMQRTEKLPGFSGLSGEVDGSDRGGNLTLKAHKLTLDAPQLMPEPLAFDTFAAEGRWQKNAGGMEVKISSVSAANADLSGTLSGSFQEQPNSPGLIDLNINLAHAALLHVNRYIPLTALGQDTHAWLQRALQGGQAEDFHLRLHGDLNDFPWADGKKGIFLIRARIKGGALDFDPAWPRIDGIAGELHIQGKRLEVVAPSATTSGLHLQKVNVTMPDMFSPGLLLQVNGQSEGETARGLDFIQHSPLRRYLDGATDGMKAVGTGSLRLSADIPLADTKQGKVSGVYRFTDNDIDIGDDVPTLYKTNGELDFTDSYIRVKNATARILGGPATLSLQSGADGAVECAAHGRTDMDALGKYVSHPLLSYLHGGADWEAEIKVQKKLSNVLVTSNMEGLASDLPAPFNKAAIEAVPLRFEMRSMTAQQDVIALQYGKLINARLLRREENGGMAVKRGTVNFGGQGKWQNRDGVWLTGTLPSFSLEGWGGLLGVSGARAAAGTPSFNIAGADILIQKLDAFGHDVDDLRVNARNQNGALTAQIASRTVNGEASWQGQGRGKLVARLKNLTLGAGEAGGDKKEKMEPPRSAPDSGKITSTEFPALDLAVEELYWKDKPFGRMELLAQQHGREWQLERMRIANPDGVLSADGKYFMAEGRALSRVNLKLEISDAGKVLARFGYPESVNKGSGVLAGEFSWRGAPDDFSYSALDGALRLDTGKGQFLKIDTGAGKLLSILSLQALPKHITLDFNDVFSEGFAFDDIKGTAQIKQGVLTSNDFKIEGSAAKVNMSGQIDLYHETQDLRVRIEPTVGNLGVIVGGVVGGPVGLVGTWVVDKILGKPLDKLASFEYNITGTWVNPSVVKIGQQKATVPSQLVP